MIEETIIVGAGPSGISAAIQLARYRVAPLVLESCYPGGLIREANSVENYPGFPEGMVGYELADRLVAQAKKAGVRILQRRAVTLQWENKLFRVGTNQGVLFSRTLIIASGTKPRKLSGIRIDRGSKERVIYGISPLANCEGKHVVVIGGGDAAYDYALNLCRKNIVLILNRGEHTKCLPLLRDQAESVASIRCLKDASIQTISRKDDGLIINGIHSGKPLVIKTDCVLGAIGRDPQTDFFSDIFIAKMEELKESRLLHLVGDIKNGRFRQAAIAAGDGVLAGMMVFNVLRELGRQK